MSVWSLLITYQVIGALIFPLVFFIAYVTFENWKRAGKGSTLNDNISFMLGLVGGTLVSIFAGQMIGEAVFIAVFITTQ
jgi:hypothetical protein